MYIIPIYSELGNTDLDVIISTTLSQHDTTVLTNPVSLFLTRKQKCKEVTTLSRLIITLPVKSPQLSNLRRG